MGGWVGGLIHGWLGVLSRKGKWVDGWAEAENMHLSLYFTCLETQ